MVVTSDRDRCLEALKAVLSDIPGVKHVYRDGQVAGNVADPQLPAIIIMEDEGSYSRHNDLREYLVKFNVELHLLARARKTAESPHGNVGQVRELFTHTVINTLVHNPQLTVQLSDEDEPQNHCNFVGDTYKVRYDEEMDFPYVAACVSFDVRLVTTLDDRALETWTAWAVEASPPGADEESILGREGDLST